MLLSKRAMRDQQKGCAPRLRRRRRCTEDCFCCFFCPEKRGPAGRYLRTWSKIMRLGQGLFNGILSYFWHSGVFALVWTTSVEIFSSVLSRLFLTLKPQKRTSCSRCWLVRLIVRMFLTPSVEHSYLFWYRFACSWVIGHYCSSSITWRNFIFWLFFPRSCH
jgi:hypothetical protein